MVLAYVLLLRAPDPWSPPLQVLYCARKAGVTHVLKAGGAQAVAAMGWGTASCPKVSLRCSARGGRGLALRAQAISGLRAALHALESQGHQTLDQGQSQPPCDRSMPATL
jgi:hypothetical protein